MLMIHGVFMENETKIRTTVLLESAKHFLFFRLLKSVFSFLFFSRFSETVLRRRCLRVKN